MSGSSVGKNAAWLMTAATINKLVAFLTFVFVARLVGPSVTGVYFFSVSITSIFVILADLGMTPVVIRAISGSREDGERLLGAALRLKCALIPIAALCALGYLSATHQSDPIIFSTVAIACLVMSADAVNVILYGALRGRQNLRPEAIGMLVGQLVTSLGSVTAALAGFGAVGLVVALLGGSVWNVIWAFVHARAVSILSRAPLSSDYRRLAREAAPFAIAGISVKLYSYADSLLLHAFHGSIAVGMYAVAYKMTYALQFIPLAVTAALYPALSKQWAEQEHASVRATFLGAMRFLAAVGFPLSAGLSALAPRILPLLYGSQYVDAIAAFEVLPWVLLPIFMDFPIGSLLNASHRAHLKTTAMVATMLLNIVLNVMLVPAYGPLGAAWAGVGSFWTLLAIGMFFVVRDAGGWRLLLSPLIRASIAAGVAWIAFRVVGAPMPLFAAALFGSAISVLAAFALRLVSPQDVARLLRRARGVLQEEAPHADS